MNMKKIALSLFCLFSSHFLFAQWAKSNSDTNNIYNTNSGYVGIGTTSPSTLLEVKSGIDVLQTSTQYVGPYSLGETNDFAGGGAAQYILLIPQFAGTTGEAAAGMSGVFREYRGSPGSYNQVYEYDVIGQTAYSATFINLIPKSAETDVLNLYSVTYGGVPYLAILASDMILSGGYCTFTGHFWNNINSMKPQIVLASTCSNISVFQSATFLAGTALAASASGYVGINTSNPQGALQVLGPDPAYDDPTVLYLTNNSTDFGRTSLVLTGRLENGNDGWAFGMGARNAIVFNENISTTEANIGAIGTPEYSLQLEGNSKSLGFLSTTNGNTPNMVLTQSGNIGIGTNNPQTMLSVEGVITAKELNITQTGWSDFVFDSAYQRMTLDKVASYVSEHKHLPDIPSAAQIEQGGLDIGAMERLHMQKIEELTLYVIDADKHAQQQDMLISQQQALLLQLQEQLKLQKQEIEQLKQQGHQ